MEVKDIIKQAGLKVTPQRIMIYEIILELGHSSMDEIVAKVQLLNPDMTISTIYRVLDSFCEAQLLSRVNHPNGKYYYDITPSDHHHIFKDGEIIDYNDMELTDLIKKHLKGKIFENLDIERISVQIIANNKN